MKFSRPHRGHSFSQFESPYSPTQFGNLAMSRAKGEYVIATEMEKLIGLNMGQKVVTTSKELSLFVQIVRRESQKKISMLKNVIWRLQASSLTLNYRSQHRFIPNHNPQRTRNTRTKSQPHGEHIHPCHCNHQRQLQSTQNDNKRLLAHLSATRRKYEQYEQYYKLYEQGDRQARDTDLDAVGLTNQSDVKELRLKVSKLRVSQKCLMAELGAARDRERKRDQEIGMERDREIEREGYRGGLTLAREQHQMWGMASMPDVTTHPSRYNHQTPQYKQYKDYIKQQSMPNERISVKLIQNNQQQNQGSQHFQNHQQQADDNRQGMTMARGHSNRSEHDQKSEFKSRVSSVKKAISVRYRQVEGNPQLRQTSKQQKTSTRKLKYSLSSKPKSPLSMSKKGLTRPASPASVKPSDMNDLPRLSQGESSNSPVEQAASKGINLGGRLALKTSHSGSPWRKRQSFQDESALYSQLRQLQASLNSRDEKIKVLEHSLQHFQKLIYQHTDLATELQTIQAELAQLASQKQSMKDSLSTLHQKTAQIAVQQATITTQETKISTLQGQVDRLQKVRASYELALRVEPGDAREIERLFREARRAGRVRVESVDSVREQAQFTAYQYQNKLNHFKTVFSDVQIMVRHLASQKHRLQSSLNRLLQNLSTAKAQLNTRLSTPKPLKKSSCQGCGDWQAQLQGLRVAVEAIPLQ